MTNAHLLHMRVVLPVIRIMCVLVAGQVLWGETARGEPRDTRTVAITVDDLPGASGADVSEIEAQNAAVIAALARHHVRATGFVIGGRVSALPDGRGLRVLRQWTRAGYDLGNHTASHRPLDDLTLDEFRTEVMTAERVISSVMRRRRRLPRYFRFPENHTGDTLEQRDGAAALLAKLGYVVAVCTIENDDTVFARAYDRARAAHDEGIMTQLRARYASYTDAKIKYFTDLHRQLFGRDTSQVMLLHVNRLNADALDDVLTRFERDGYRFVPLSVALADPAYRTRDGFVGRAGPMWAYRWARGLNVRVDGRLEPELSDLSSTP